MKSVKMDFNSDVYENIGLYFFFFFKNMLRIKVIII